MNYIVYVPTLEGKYYLTEENTFSQLIAEAKRFIHKEAKSTAKQWDVDSNTQSDPLEVWHCVSKLSTNNLQAA